MDMHGIIFDVDDTRDDMAQPFSEHIKSSMESGTHFAPPRCSIAVAPPSAEVHTEEQHTAIMVCFGK